MDFPHGSDFLRFIDDSRSSIECVNRCHMNFSTQCVTYPRLCVCVSFISERFSESENVVLFIFSRFPKSEIFLKWHAVRIEGGVFISNPPVEQP